MDLGKIFYVDLAKDEPTMWILDKLWWSATSLEADKYNTVCLRKMFCLAKSEHKNGKLVETTCKVSLYIKLHINNAKQAAHIYQTMTKLKLNHCDKLFYADYYKKSIFLDKIIEVFKLDLFDEHGEYFFEHPLMFRGQSSYAHDKEGFGKSSSYYIVGASYEEIRKNAIKIQ